MQHTTSGSKWLYIAEGEKQYKRKVERTLQLPTQQISNGRLCCPGSEASKSIVHSLDLPPTKDEVMKAVKQTSSGKAPGMDEIPAEIFMSASPVALKAFQALLTNIWEEADMAKDVRNATISVLLFNNKSSRADWQVTAFSLL